MSRITTFAPVAVVLATASLAADAPRTATDTWQGVIIQQIDTPAGRIRVHLPDDIRAGDTISGTVLSEPKGKSEAERERNRAKLDAYAYETRGNVVRPERGVLRFVVPAAAGVLPMILRDGRGKEVAVTSVHVGAASNQKLTFNLPKIGQAGRPVEIHGPFDGHFGNTNVMVGGAPVQIIAESPRKAVFNAPQGQTGRNALIVREGNVEARGTYRNVGVNLSAPKTALIRGERTTLTVRVSGLEGMEPERVPLTLTGSPTIRLDGGNVQSVSLQPNASGVAVFTRTITGQQAGAFTVNAQISYRQDPPKRDPLFPGALDMNGIDSVKQLLGIVASMNDDARTALLQATLKALRQRLADAQDESTRKWLRNKIKIVEGVMDVLGIPH